MSYKILNKITQRLPISSYPYKRFMHKHKCIFIHIPKNAGTSVLTLFNDTGGRKHAKWYDFFESNSYFFNRYHKFAIVRAPLARLYSAYRYAIEGGNQSTIDIALSETIKKGSDDFNSFISLILDEHFIMLQTLFQPQYLYIFDRQYNCKVDSMLKIESLKSDWKSLSNILALPSQLPLTNTMESSLVEKQSNNQNLSEEAVKKVRSLYHYDYLLLGYLSTESKQSAEAYNDKPS